MREHRADTPSLGPVTDDTPLPPGERGWCIAVGTLDTGPTVVSNTFEGLPRRERLEATVAIGVSVAMATLDTAVTNTALPTIARDLGADGANAIWVINAYQLAMIAALLPLAALGDIVGHRRVYIIGLVLFTATSLGCGVAWSLPSLIAARTLQGFGAAAIMSVNSALIRFIYPARSLGRGVGVNALVVALGFTLGPTVASLILSITSWHWIFLINIPAGIVGDAALPAQPAGLRPGDARFRRRRGPAVRRLREPARVRLQRPVARWFGGLGCQ